MPNHGPTPVCGFSLSSHRSGSLFHNIGGPHGSGLDPSQCGGDSDLDRTSQNRIRDEAVKVDIGDRRDRRLEEVKEGFLGEGTLQQSFWLKEVCQGERTLQTFTPKWVLAMCWAQSVRLRIDLEGHPDIRPLLPSTGWEDSVSPVWSLPKRTCRPGKEVQGTWNQK